MFYAVNKGHKTGVYGSWDECNQQVTGYKGAVFKKFSTFEEAENFVNGTKKIKADPGRTIYVDGGFNKHTGSEAWGSVVNGYGRDLVEYAYHNGLIQDIEVKYVDLPVGRRMILVAKFEGVQHQNNGAELLALVIGLRIAIFLVKNNIPVDTVLSDSQVILYWSIRLKDDSAATFDPRKVSYIHELINLRREFESMNGKVDKVDGGENLADLGYHVSK